MRQLRTALSGFAPGLVCLLLATVGAAIIGGLLAMHVIASPRNDAMSAGTAPASSASMRMPAPTSAEPELLGGASAAADTERPPGHDATAIACALALLVVGLLLAAAPVGGSAWARVRVALAALPRLSSAPRGPPDLDILCVCRT